MESVTVDDVTIPAIGLGTARTSGEPCERMVRRALELGYRHVDTAQIYENEAAVGAGIDGAGVDPEEVFVTTKLGPDNRARDDVFTSVAESVDRLGTGTVDLLLIHAPNEGVPLEETIGAMNELQERGTVDHVGVSNFSVEETRAAVDASETPIVTNQVEYHPYTSQHELLEFCIQNDVVLTAYSPLDVGRAAADSTLGEVGRAHGKTAAQVALRWLVQQPNVAAIPKASSEDHLRENLDVFDFTLEPDEFERVSGGEGDLFDRVRRLLG